MRRRAGLLVPVAVALVAASLLAGCGSSDSQKVSGSHWTMTLPSGWEKIGDTSKGLAENLGSSGLSERLGGDYKLDIDGAFGKGGGFVSGRPTNVTVVKEDLPAGIDLARYKEISLENAPRIGARVGTPVDTTLGGRPAFRFETTISATGRTFRIRAVSSVFGRTAYTVTLTAQRDEFSDVVGDFSEMLSSWRWRM